MIMIVNHAQREREIKSEPAYDRKIEGGSYVMKEQTGKPSSGEKGEPALQKFYVLLVVPDSRVTPDIASTDQFSTACPDQAKTDMNLGWC